MHAVESSGQALNLIKTLLLRNPNFDLNWRQRSKLNRTLLHASCEANKPEIVKFLLDHPHLDLNLPNTTGETPLFPASVPGKESVLKLLIMDSSINLNAKNNFNHTVLRMAAPRGNLLAIKYLIASGKPLDLGPLISLSDKQQEEHQHFLSNLPRQELPEAIYYAIEYDKYEVAQLLITYWQSPNTLTLQLQKQLLE